MPSQETLLRQQIGDKHIEVIKTYDVKLAREAFEEMDKSARAFLWKALRINDSYDPSELPSPDSVESEDFLWEELIDDSREHGNASSFFVVNAINDASSTRLYVSPDWPSAEQFARQLV